jgi:hypothetical protein
LFAASPVVSDPTDTLAVYAGKDPANATPTYYLYHAGEQGPAGWYDVNDVNGGAVTGAVFTPDTLMKLVTGAEGTPFIFSNYVENTIVAETLGSFSLKAGSKYKVEFKVNFVDLAGSNAPISVLYSGLYASGGNLQIQAHDLEARSTVWDFQINNPATTTKLVLAEGTFAAVAGPTFGNWTINGLIVPSSDGIFSITLGQNTASVDPLFFSAPTMSVTLLAD